MSEQVVYETFGTVRQDTPTSRIVGPGSFPDGEVHRNITSINYKITTYGDDPADAFIHVCGLDGDTVRHAWVAVAHHFRTQLASIWGWTPEVAHRSFSFGIPEEQLDTQPDS